MRGFIQPARLPQIRWTASHRARPSLSQAVWIQSLDYHGKLHYVITTPRHIAPQVRQTRGLGRLCIRIEPNCRNRPLCTERRRECIQFAPDNGELAPKGSKKKKKKKRQRPSYHTGHAYRLVFPLVGAASSQYLKSEDKKDTIP
ncbi:hypothetical protein SAMD00023353_0300930 [Rosellinia necatrix]|uniref:Uncharacterized protein n=1 Tax=Rosellinia necatrix TaxID=77044 RepID=A0A1S8A682_ROSNE|nr:hypothetical protein SAMD00023353_0300930 [Rosellinia necatrix]